MWIRVHELAGVSKREKPVLIAAASVVSVAGSAILTTAGVMFHVVESEEEILELLGVKERKVAERA